VGTIPSRSVKGAKFTINALFFNLLIGSFEGAYRVLLKQRWRLVVDGDGGIEV